MWEDAELFIAALGAVPDLINICILSGKEMMEQLRKYPPPLLDGVLARILERIDGKALGFTISAAFKLVHRIYHAPGGPLKRLSLIHISLRKSPPPLLWRLNRLAEQTPVSVL